MTTDIYFKSILNKNIYIEFKDINNNLEKNILTILKDNYEGKCTNDGYIKVNSINIITHSSGIVINKNIKFDVTFECMICYPVEGMIIECIIKNITKAGLRCIINDNGPLIIFVAKDHHYMNNEFNNLKENDKIHVRIIGQRFELNDSHICVIGEFNKKLNNQIKIENKSQSEKNKKFKFKTVNE